MHRLARWYAQRIVNVNVNIVVAGIAALGITVAVMHPLELLGFHHWVERKTGLDHKLAVGGLTFLVDLVADIVVYFALHWLANHWPGRASPKILKPQHAHPTFMRDATMVQVQRMVLGPLFYMTALGTQHAMLRAQFSVAASTAVGFGLGLVFTRVLHTMWMLRQERRLVQRLDQEELAAQLDSLSEDFTHTPTDVPHPNTSSPNTSSPDSSSPETSGQDPAARPPRARTPLANAANRAG